MDIRNWPIGRIMQLPDHCFGSRFEVCLFASAVTGTNGWDISGVTLPERCVIWECLAYPSRVGAGVDYYRLALGDILPTTVAEMDALEPLFMGLGVQGPDPRLIPVTYFGSSHFNRIKMPVMAAGRRVVLEVRAVNVAPQSMQVVLTVSSIPMEVPDCLVSV